MKSLPVLRDYKLNSRNTIHLNGIYPIRKEMASQMLSVLLLVLVALAYSQVAFAYDPSPLQDFCVAGSTSKGMHIYL
jgi:hypothetical protein